MIAERRIQWFERWFLPGDQPAEVVKGGHGQGQPGGLRHPRELVRGRPYLLDFLNQFLQGVLEDVAVSVEIRLLNDGVPLVE